MLTLSATKVFSPDRRPHSCSSLLRHEFGQYSKAFTADAWESRQLPNGHSLNVFDCEEACVG